MSIMVFLSAICGALIGIAASVLTGFSSVDWEWWVICLPLWIVTGTVFGTASR